MTESVYEQLANRLDAIPSGYPRTVSGVELHILEKLFTPQQAALANVMRLLCKSPEKIAEAAGIDPAKIQPMLDQMVADGLIRVERGKEGPIYGLMPFVVGIYEMNLHRLDAELAALIEAYFQETGAGNSIFTSPPIHRVIPIDEAISFDLEVHPYEQATAFLEDAKSWGVRDCICRVQKDLIGEGCHHPKEVCLTFSHKEHAFDNAPATRPIGKAEAFEILALAREAGLVHTTGNYRDGHQYICNCCTCSCGVLRGLAEFKMPTAVAHSNFVAASDEALCAGCGDCMARCQFDAISLPDGYAVVDASRCLGCGQCVSICSTEAMRLRARPRSDQEPLPANLSRWMVRRAITRRSKLLDVL